MLGSSASVILLKGEKGDEQMKEDRLISKSPYNYSQVSGFIVVKQYMLVRTDGKKCVMLRFANEADYAVDYFDFTLIQLDSKGGIIEKTHVECNGLSFGAGNTYAMDKGIIVDEKCIDIRVQMESARSGNYRYTVSGGRRVVAHYDCEETWKYLSATDVAADLKKNKQFSELNSRKKERHPYAFIRFVAIVTVLVVLLVNLIPYVNRLLSYMGLEADNYTEKYDLDSISGVDYVEI